MNIELNLSKNRGFTLLELLVVVSIIAFLSSLSIIALSSSQRNTRDKQRQIDQLSILKHAELYTNDFGVVPTQVQPVSIFITPYDHAGTQNNPIPRLLNIKTVYGAIFGPGPGGGSCTPPYPLCPLQCWDNITCSCVPCEGEYSPICGNNVCEATETVENCAIDCSICGDGICSSNESYATCSQDCPGVCNNNAVCEPESGENVGNCPNDCFSANGPVGATCGNSICDAGETPGNCSSDCSNFSMCYVNGEWNLCCLFGGSYCVAGGETSGGGYYGVCNIDKCEQRYLLQKPAFTCTSNQDCIPDAGLGGGQNKFVSDGNTNWLKGLEAYLVTLPKDPGHKKAKPGEAIEIEITLNRYWASSHPDIVKNHRFCVWAAMENENYNGNPYNDITETPTGPMDWERWNVLCLM